MRDSPTPGPAGSDDTAGGSGGMSRRRFLRAVGVSGGAGVMLATMGALDLAVTSDASHAGFSPPSPADFSLTGRAAGSVVILGGGVAGLAAAYELGKAGWNCTVLEAQNRIGGRSLTVRGGDEHVDLDGHRQRVGYSEGQYFNAGPARIAQWMVTMDYCRELGVPLEVFANHNSDAYIFREGNGMKPGQPVRRRAAQSDVYGYVSELLAKATNQGALDQAMTPQDKEKLLAFLRDFGNVGNRIPGTQARDWRYLGGSQRGYTAWPGAAGVPFSRALPVPPLSQVFASEVGQELTFNVDFRHDHLMFQPVGGMDAIPLALAARVGPGRIKLGCLVTGVIDGPDRVAVTYREPDGREQRIEADYCISTLPPNLMARVPHNLGPAVQNGLTTFRPTSAGKIGLEYRSRWWETQDRIYGGITETDMDITRIWYPSHGFHSQRGVVVGYYNTDEKADAYAALRPGEREARALAQGMKVHGPKYRTELLTSFSVAWTRVPHVEGAWMDIPKDIDDPVFAPLVNGAGRVYFAGDWLSHVVSWQHGSLTSARKVVSALHRREVSV